MKLELKHLAPYLPYGLKCVHDNTVRTIIGIRENFGIWWYIFYDETGETSAPIHRCQPILRLLSEVALIEECFHHLSPYFHNLKYMDGGVAENIISAPYDDLLKLFEWHFDVFGLIENGLAIDKTTINQ